MAATVSDLGNNVSTTASATLATGATITGAVASKDWFVVLVACANTGTAGIASLTTVVDSGGTNVYTNRAKITYSPGGSASDGATIGVYTCPVTADITSGTITANFSPNTPEKAIQVYRVRPAAGETVSLIAVDATGSTGNVSTYSAATVSVVLGDIIFGAAAIETDDAVTGDTDTTNGSWSAVITRLADGGADASTMSCVSQYKTTTTATGNQAWAATTSVARDSARTYLVLRSAPKSIVADLGTYALTGTDPTRIGHGFFIAGDPGAYVLTGTDPTRIGHGFFIAADAGSYAVTGSDATLTKTTIINNYIITAGDESTDDLLLETGDFLLLETGDLLQLQQQTIAGGTYALTGTDAAPSKGYRLTVDVGSYTLTGTDATGVHKFVLDATVAASYVLTGTDAPLLHGWRIAAGDETLSDLLLETGDHLLLETSDLLVLEGAAIAGGTYALTGTDATLTKTVAGAFTVTADPGSYLLTGTPATLTYQPISAPIILPTRGEWPEKKRYRREHERAESVRSARAARDALRASIGRLLDGGDYDAPVVLEEAATTATEVRQLPRLPLSELQVVEDLIAQLQEFINQRLLGAAQIDMAAQLAQQHLAETAVIADEVMRHTRRNYLARTLLLIAE